MGMKVYISEFIRIRYFAPEVIPVSVSTHIPRWYGKDGATCELLTPNMYCVGMRRCRHEPNTCEYRKNYRKQLQDTDFNSVLTQLENIALSAGKDKVCLVVNTGSSNICCTTVILKQWFTEHGMVLEEI